MLYALRGEGFEAVHCLTAHEALRLAGAQRFDLAVLDVGLPDMSGFALCHELRRARDLPVIFLTAHAAEADRLLGLAIGADDYMSKPFSPRELVARVRAVLRRIHGSAIADAGAGLLFVVLAGDHGGHAQGRLVRLGSPGLQLEPKRAALREAAHVWRQDFQ